MRKTSILLAVAVAASLAAPAAIPLAARADDAAATATQPPADTGHGANRGWLDAVDEGQAAGTTGQDLPMEAFEAALYWEGHNAGIRMRSAGAGSVWGEWQTKVSGTTGRGLALHAIAVELTGDRANSYDIYYRVHIANLGWLGWSKKGYKSLNTGLKTDQ